MDHEQTRSSPRSAAHFSGAPVIWLAPRATAFTEICEACEEDDPALYRDLHAVVSGRLRIDEQQGWVTCARGHTMRVIRISPAVPAGALW